MGPELLPTGPRVSATCSAPSLPSRPRPLDPCSPTRCGTPCTPPARHSPGRAQTQPLGATADPRHQLPSPPPPHPRLPLLPYSCSGAWPPGTDQWEEAMRGRAPGLQGLQGFQAFALSWASRSAPRLLWQLSDAGCPRIELLSLGRFGHLSPSLLLPRRQWRAIPVPPPSRVTLGKSSRSFFFFLQIYQ